MSEASPRPRPKRTLGRKIALAVYWALAVFLVAVGYLSVVPQVFWPKYPASAARAMPEDCHQGVRLLRDELSARSADFARRGGIDGEDAIDRWLRSWDDRHHAMSPRCRGAEREAWREAARLRHRIDATLRRNHRDHAALTAALARELDQR